MTKSVMPFNASTPIINPPVPEIVRLLELNCASIFCKVLMFVLESGNCNSAFSNEFLILGVKVIFVFMAGVFVVLSPNITNKLSLDPVKPVIAGIAGEPRGVETLPEAAGIRAVASSGGTMITELLVVPDKPKTILASGTPAMVTTPVESLMLNVLTPIKPEAGVDALAAANAISIVVSLSAVKLIVSIL